MVDITAKPVIYREATAQGEIKLKTKTIRLIKDGKIEKGDPLQVAKIAGILAAKNSSLLIPLCHPITLTNVQLDIVITSNSTIKAQSTVKTKGQTGVEMEALVATAIALLTIWDMTKKYEKDTCGQYPYTIIQNIHITHKVKEPKK